MSPSPLPPDSSADAALQAAVAPRDWVNPPPAGRYNLVVIGGGPAGLVCAAGAAGLGARVALVERHYLGGDCLNSGCVPSKALLQAARVWHAARHSSTCGVRGGEHLQLDFPAVMARLRRLRSEIAQHDSASRFRDLGIDLFFGTGRFVARDTVAVGASRLRFAKAVICSGARPTLPPIPGLAEAGCLTSDTIFDLDTLPPRLAIIGAGPLGCELAQAFARFGSQVTLLEAAPRFLEREDPEAAALLRTVLEQDGVTLHLGVKILAVARHGAAQTLHFASAAGSETLTVDTLLVGAGRTANIEELDLASAGIVGDRGGVQVDAFLRTANRHVYAAGDVCAAWKFTHMADAQARLVLANALFGGRRRVSALTVPWCTYTDPEIAHVGLSAAEAGRRGNAVTTLTVPMAEIDRAILDGATTGFARVHLQGNSDRILGATLVGRHAGETIGELALAMTSGLGLKAIAATIHPYPTQAEALRKLGDAWQRRRLTPLLRELLGRWLAWQRR